MEKGASAPFLVGSVRGLAAGGEGEAGGFHAFLSTFFGQRDPLAAAQDFAGAEFGFVGHLAALLDPVAEIDVGQFSSTARVDQPEDGVGAKRTFVDVGAEETVDGGEAVAQAVGQAGAEQRSGGVAEFDDRGFDRGVLDHGAVVVEAHGRHVAVAVADLLVVLEEVELLGGGARRHFLDDEVRVQPGDAFLRAAGGKIPGADADGDAGIAGRADRRVGDVVAAPEAAAGETVVQGLGSDAGKFGHHLALRPARQIGARQGRGGVEEMRAAGGLEAHSVVCLGVRGAPSTTFYDVGAG